MAMTTILIVDDSASNRAIYARLAGSLDPDRIRAVEIATPREALDWLRTRAADLIITDYCMPGLDGAAFTRLVRTGTTCPDVPVIVVTAYNEADYSTRAFEAGATEFVRTPLDHTEFRTRVNNVLRMDRQHKELQRHARQLEHDLAASAEANQLIAWDSREALMQVIDGVPALISATDRQGRPKFSNALHRHIRQTGHAPAGSPADPLVQEREQRDASLDQFVLSTGGALPPFEEEIHDPDGNRIVLLTTKTPLRGSNGEVASVLTTAVDITARKIVDEQLFHLAHHDPLTGLPNRLLLASRIDQALARGGRGDHLFATHFIDLDKFKLVNDELGHTFGDELLRQVSARLGAAVRQSDVLARLGGDEFAILQSPVTGEAEAVDFATQVMAALRAPFPAQGGDITISASIGTALHPRDGKTYDELISNADLAMYSVKLARRDQHRMFTPSMARSVGGRLKMRDDLRRALIADDLRLVYQPQVDMRSGRIVAVEALLRWTSPDGAEVPPCEFLAVAEEGNLIAGIDAAVMAKACAQAAAWRRDGLAPIRMCVNISPTDFDVADIHDLVRRSLATSGLEPSLLELELTERTLARNIGDAACTLRKIKDLGVQISIDDFGIGYSSMDALRIFPVDRLKIDRSFVMDIATSRADPVIVKAIIDIGLRLNLGIIAEGVETIEQLTYLVGEGCNDFQGYYFSKAVPPHEIPSMVRRKFFAP